MRRLLSDEAIAQDQRSQRSHLLASGAEEKVGRRSKKIETKQRVAPGVCAAASERIIIAQTPTLHKELATAHHKHRFRRRRRWC